jgi:hypothetical protein
VMKSLSGGLILALFLSLQACLQPYPVDMRQTLTVAVEEVNPTATGLAESIPRATPAPHLPLATEPPTPSGGFETITDSPLHAVVLVGQGNFLNVRAGPGIDQPILETLPPNARDLKITGQHEGLGDERWIEIRRQTGETGWVNASYVTQQVPSEAFCGNPRIRTLLRDFENAILLQDGEQFSDLVSRRRGLTIRQTWWNPEVNFSAGEVAAIFNGTGEREWGLAPGVGEPVVGSFQEVILPQLLDVLSSEYSQACNTLQQGVGTGPTAGQADWPFEYQNFNYVALYRKAPSGQELDWRTWALGVEIVDAQPYLVYLVQYHWEP